MQWARGGGEAHIRLDPRQFGDMTVSLRVDQGQVVARLQAEAPAVREWLQTNQGLLRQSLSEQNLTLDRLEVSEPREARDTDRREREQTQRDEQQKPRRRRPDTGETFDFVA
jgi:flagellar hook-length control protein FliK